MEVGFENGKISLDHENGVYYSGQLVKGNINFILKQFVNITAINIQYLGEAKVQWWEEEKEVRSGQTFKTKVEYKGQEQYFNFVQCLTGGLGAQQLKPGTHNYPFQFEIPCTVPSSFKGEKGEVSYEIRAYMEFPEQTKDRKEMARLFEVVAPLDLNKVDSSIAQPIQLSFEEVYNCGCACASRPVSVDLALPAAGYCPGQAVPVTIDVKNDTNIEVKSISMQIVAKHRYHSKQPIANFSTPEQKLVSRKTGPVLSSTERHFNYELTLPDMIAPNLNNCQIIDVEYYFKVKIKLSGCNDDLQDDAQIYIGFKPLQAITNGEYVHPLADRLPSGPIPDNVLHTIVPHVNQPAMAIYSGYPGYNKPAPMPPFPSQPPPYPTVPYPVSNPAYPAPNPAYPATNPAFPATNPAFPAPNIDIGFKIPPTSPSYPM